MDRKNRLAFYEKHYFYEFECREKITARLQLALAMLTGLLGLFAYCLTRVDYSAVNISLALILLFFFVIASFVSVMTASRYFIAALWGHTYKCVSLTTEIESYRKELISFYVDYDAVIARNAFLEYLIKDYCKCAAENAKINSDRYESLHESVSYMVYSIPLILLSILMLALGDFLNYS